MNQSDEPPGGRRLGSWSSGSAEGKAVTLAAMRDLERERSQPIAPAEAVSSDAGEPKKDDVSHIHPAVEGSIPGTRFRGWLKWVLKRNEGQRLCLAASWLVLPPGAVALAFGLDSDDVVFVTLVLVWWAISLTLFGIVGWITVSRLQIWTTVGAVAGGLVGATVEGGDAIDRGPYILAGMLIGGFTARGVARRVQGWTEAIARSSTSLVQSLDGSLTASLLAVGSLWLLVSGLDRWLAALALAAAAVIVGRLSASNRKLGR